MHGHKSLLEGQKAKALPTREGPHQKQQTVKWLFEAGGENLG